MRKYVFVPLIILALTIFAAGCINQNPFTDKYLSYHYNGSVPEAQFSFEYPENGTVEIVQSTISTPQGRKDAPNLLVYVTEVDKTRLQVQILGVPNFGNATFESWIERQNSDISDRKDFAIISATDIAIAGAEGRKFVYTHRAENIVGNFTGIRRAAFFEKGGYQFMIHDTHFAELNSSRADAAYERILKTFSFISPEGEKVFCMPESRNAGACIQLYKPVCGWSDPEKIQCIKYPCAQTFSNNCFACAGENVLYYTDGECPA